MLMSRRIHPAAKVFTLVLTIAFGLIALAVSYAALKGGLELRSKAALPPQTIVKAWEFKRDNDFEGWQGFSGSVEGGLLILHSGDESIQLLNKSVNAVLLPGAKLTVQFSMFPLGRSGNVPAFPAPVVEEPSEPVLGVKTDKDSNLICAQVITYARSKSGECKAFATPCDVPPDWIADKTCSVSPSGRPTEPVPCVQALTPARHQRTKKCMIFSTSCIENGFALDPYCGFPNKFSVDVSYRVKGKKEFEKPVSISLAFTEVESQQFTATLPLPIVKEIQVEEMRIVFPQLHMWMAIQIEVDWIRLTAPAPKPTPTCTPLPKCATEGTIGSNGRRIFCDIKALPGTIFCPNSSPTPPNGCKYQEVQCVKAPCDLVLVCPTLTPTPGSKRPEPTPTPKKSDWCKIMRLLPGGKSSAEYKKNCG